MLRRSLVTSYTLMVALILAAGNLTELCHEHKFNDRRGPLGIQLPEVRTITLADADAGTELLTVQDVQPCLLARSRKRLAPPDCGSGETKSHRLPMSAPLETQTPPLVANCAVCGIPFSGLAAVFLRWRGIRRSPRNPNCCTQCGAHLEEGRLVEMTVVFADLSSFTEMTGRLGATTTYSVVDEFLRLASTTLMSHGAFIDKYI